VIEKKRTTPTKTLDPNAGHTHLEHIWRVERWQSRKGRRDQKMGAQVNFSALGKDRYHSNKLIRKTKQSPGLRGKDHKNKMRICKF
jgi:hypothetical protein